MTENTRESVPAHHYETVRRMLNDLLIEIGLVRRDLSLDGPELMLAADTALHHLRQENARGPNETTAAG